MERKCFNGGAIALVENESIFEKIGKNMSHFEIYMMCTLTFLEIVNVALDMSH